MAHHPLAGVIEKLRNADVHLDRLYAETRAYVDGGSNAVIRSERDTADNTRGRFIFQVVRQPPLTIAAIAGDVVHNLRSGLDYIVRELVKSNNQRPTFHHQFPICGEPEGFTTALNQRRLHGVPTKATTFIEGIQPYHSRPEARPKHPLLLLHQLSNRDKHHMLAVAALNARFDWRFVAGDGRLLRQGTTTEPRQNGDVLAEVPTDFTFDGTKAQLQMKLSVTVGFSEPSLAGFEVLGCLDGTREWIGRFVIPAFALFFDPLPDDLRLTSHSLSERLAPSGTGA